MTPLLIIFYVIVFLAGFLVGYIGPQKKECKSCGSKNIKYVDFAITYQEKICSDCGKKEIVDK